MFLQNFQYNSICQKTTGKKIGKLRELLKSIKIERLSAASEGLTGLWCVLRK